jgi:hypothetical protein
MSKWVPVENRIFAKNFYAQLANWLIKENCVTTNFAVRESREGKNSCAKFYCQYIYMAAVIIVTH